MFFCFFNLIAHFNSPPPKKTQKTTDNQQFTSKKPKKIKTDLQKICKSVSAIIADNCRFL